MPIGALISGRNGKHSERILPFEIPPSRFELALPGAITRTEPELLATGSNALERNREKPAGDPDRQPSGSSLDSWVLGLQQVRDAVGGLPRIPTSLWAFGILLIGGFKLAQYAWFARRVRRAVPASPAIRAEAARAAQACGLSRIPELLLVHDRLSPMLWCGRRIRLLIPVSLWSQLDREGRHVVLCHEFAHLRRRDHWVRMAETAINTVFWWNPVAWWVTRRVDEAAEHCCDAWVTWLNPHQRRVYAQALLTTKSYLSTNGVRAPSLGIGITSARAKRFARRLTMVMTHSVRPKLSMPGTVVVAMVLLVGWIATPAQSCPKEEKVKVKKVGAPHSDCDCGKCADCKAHAHAHAASHSTSYEKHMADRHAPAVVTAAAGGEARRSAGAASRSDRDLEDRLRRLEERVDRLLEQLEGQGGRAGVVMPAPPNPGTGPRFFQPRHPQAPPAPPAPAPPRAGRGPFDLGSGGGVFAAPDSGKKEWRTYELPKGKLKEFSGLMIRSDVPVLVRPGDDHIEIQATPREHEIFRAFFNLIHPPKNGPTSDASDAAAVELYYAMAPEAQSQGEYVDAARAYLSWASDAAAQRQELAAGAYALDAREAQLHAERASLEAQVRALEVQAAALEDQSRMLEEQAIQMEHQAEEIEDLAEEHDGDERKARKAEARNILEIARSNMRQAEQLHRQMEQIQRQAERMHERLMEVEERADEARDEREQRRER